MTQATHETAGNAGANLYTAAYFGLTATGRTSFTNFIVLFNGSEGGRGEAESVTLTNLSLNLFSPAGTLLGSFFTVSPYTYNSFPGTGNAGFGSNWMRRRPRKRTACWRLIQIS